MNRRVVISQLQCAGPAKEIDTFFDRIVKYIPTEIVSAWVAAKGLVQASAIPGKERVMWICFAAGVIITALVILRQTAERGKPPAILQTVISTVAFVVWTIALGEPFTTLLGSTEQALYGSLLLIFYTLVAGLIRPRET
jgi:hypothetical protein